MAEAFVYKWTHKQTGKFYIGKHKGTPDDGYISSGREFLECYWKEPSQFTRELVFVGTDAECYEEEGRLIKEAIRTVGYKNIYNRTHWQIVKGWKRTCLHCGKWCDPANEEWAEAFALSHFENCAELRPKVEKKKKLSNKEWRKQREEFLLNESKTKKPEKKPPLTRIEQRKLYWKNKKNNLSTQGLTYRVIPAV